ncbi:MULTISPECIES: recombinase family protein [unclassified Pseudomonas]|uniref:recombinase family protein n=1 Tax=unclassified Pseudomonas TaxID=196821 RepID=UPI00224A53CE|nr:MULTISPECIES: recombinase family protein [unclassified Pseudomonas]MCX2814574.1 recombinase family protein [Pseudomonas sp. DCB_E]MCX9143945.1 recombinase family protein [Pseudomonas sp. DCB_Q]
MVNVVAYIRVSTSGQGESGLGLEAQRDYIERAAQANGWNISSEFVDVVSGKLALEERPEGKKALAACKQHNAQLLVAKLDRLSRSVLHIAQLMEQVDFKVATMPQADKFQLHLFAALAQQEREFIAQRTKDALAALQRRADAGEADAVAKVNRRTQALEKGRAVADITAANNIRMEKVTAFQEAVRPHIESCLFKKLDTLQAVANCLNAKGITTKRGSEWNPTAVRRLMLALNLQFPKEA